MVHEEKSLTKMEQNTRESEQRRYEAMVEEHLDPLYRTALRLTGNRSDAEDLVQETFLRAWRSFQRFEEGTNARAWLFKILMNAYIDRYRQAKRGPEMVNQEDVGEFYLYTKIQENQDLARVGNPEAFIEQIMDDHVREALNGLPPQFKMAVILADIEGFSYKEIAEILGVPVGTVMSRLHRGRRVLQQKLWDYAKRYRRLNEA